MNTKTTLRILFFCMISYIIHAQNNSISNAQNSFNMHGALKMGNDASNGKKGLLSALVPYEQIVEQTIFFRGDSLQGFDYMNFLNMSIPQFKIYSELKAYMFINEVAFIKKKYHIKELPFEKAKNTRKIEPNQVLSSACNNVDFENGNYTGWVGQVGYNNNSSAPLTVSSTGIVTAGIDSSVYACGAYHTLVTAAAANDPYGNFSPLDIGGGNYAFRLGGEDVNMQDNGTFISDCSIYNTCTTGDQSGTYSGSGGEILSQTFTVTATNTLFSFNYAAVLNDGGHPKGYQPYFGIQVFDHTGTPISCLTQTVELTAGKVPAGGHYAGLADCGDTVYVIPWQTSSINLAAYVGQALTVQFTAAGCALGRHFGYAYFDASCGQTQITSSNNSPCAGSTVILSAPPQPGQTYVWTGPGIVSTSGNTATVNTGGTYTVVVGVTPCSYSLTTSIFFATPPTLTVTPGYTTCLNAAVTFSVSGASTYTWSPSTNVSGVNSATPTVTPDSTTTTIYTVSGTTGSCTSVKTVTLAVNPLPSLMVTPAPSGTLCSTANAILTVTGANTYTWSSGPNTNTLNIAAVNTGTSTTSSTISVSGTNALHCVNSTIYTLTVLPTPIISLTAPGYTVCSGNSTSFSVSSTAGSYVWTIPPGSSIISGSNTANPNITATNTTTATTTLIYTVTGTKGSCTSAAQTVILTVNPNPTVTVNPNPSSICIGASSTLTALGASTYTWSASTGGGLPVNTGSLVVVTSSLSGTFIYTVTGTDACTNTASVSVTVNALPNLAITPSPSGTVCSAANAVLTASGANTYSWSSGAITNTVNITAINTTTTSTTNSISVVGTSTANCSNSSTYILTVSPTPSISLTPSTYTLCSGSNTSFSVSSSTTSYTWTAPSGGTILSGGTTAIPNVSATNTTNIASALVYTVTATLGACTSVAQTITLTVNPLPALTFTSNPAVICIGDNSTLNAGGANTYTWISPAGGGMPGTKGSPVIVTPTSSGSLTYTFTGTDVNTCTNTATGSITINTLPNLSITPNNVYAMCNGGTQSFTVSGAPNYTWAPSATLSGANTANPTASPSTTTIYSVTGTDVNNCSNTLSPLTVTVNVTSPPTLVLTANSYTTCNGTPQTFSVSGISAGTYTWLPAAALTGMNTANPIANPSVTTIYTVSGTENGCISSATQTLALTVNPLPSAPVISGSTLPNNAYCQGLPIHPLTVSVTATTPPTIPIWYNSAGQIVGQGASYQPATPNGTGAVIYTVIDSLPNSSGGCKNVPASGTLTVSVTIYQNPTLSIQGAIVDTALCGKSTGGVSINGTNVLSGGSPAYHYQWYNGSTAIPNDTLLNLNNVSSGTYSLQVTDAHGCIAYVIGGIGTATFTVPSSLNPVALFSTNPSPAIGTIPFTVSFTNQSTGANTYTWSFGDGNSSTLTNPTDTYTNTGSYIVALSAMAQGCPYISSYSLTVIAEIPTTLIIPNIFTPNGDGVNEEFFIPNTGLDALTCDIFNRWGELLYSITAPNQSWDGKAPNGDKAPDGTYMFILQAQGSNGKAYKQQGIITLIR